MPAPSRAEEEAIATVRAFLATWAEPEPLAAESALSFLAEGFTGIGTGPNEYFATRDAMGELFEREKAAMPDPPASFGLTWVDARTLRPDLVAVNCQIRSEVVAGGVTHVIQPRSSYLLERQDGLWRIVHMHFSTPDARHEDGDTLRDALQRRNEALEREVAERTAELERSLADLKAAQGRLIQSEKMASLGELTAGIAHEIKNPLNFVTNFAGLSRELMEELEEETDPEEREAIFADLKTNAAKIEEHGRRADGIVRAMMAHARGGAGHLQTTDVNALAREYADHALHAMKVRHPTFSPILTFDLAADAGSAEMAPQEIGRVLVNLVDNALGAVRQRASGAMAGYAPAVTVSTRRTASGVEIRVADNGPGMAPEVRAKVFEPFFTTKPAGEGTGLGLSLSHDIVAQGHGGSLTVESAQGVGTTFTVRLPLT